MKNSFQAIILESFVNPIEEQFLMMDIPIETLSPEPETPPLERVWTPTGGITTLVVFILSFLMAIIIQAVILFNANGGVEGFQAAQQTGNIQIPFVVAFVTFLTSAAAGLLSVWIGLWRMGKSFADIGLGAFNGRWVLIAALIAIPLLVVRMFAGAYLMILTANEAQTAQLETLNQVFSSGSTSPVTIAISLLMVSLVVPIWEEVFFRGFLYRWARNRLSLWPAALLSALVFGLFHMNLLQGVSVFLLGLGCAWVYEKSRSLWPAIAMHMVGNIVGQVIGYVGILLAQNLQ